MRTSGFGYRWGNKHGRQTLDSGMVNCGYRWRNKHRRQQTYTDLAATASGWCCCELCYVSHAESTGCHCIGHLVFSGKPVVLFGCSMWAHVATSISHSNTSQTLPQAIVWADCVLCFMSNRLLSLHRQSRCCCSQGCIHVNCRPLVYFFHL